MIRMSKRVAVATILAGVLTACSEEAGVGPRETADPVVVRTYEQGTRLFVETRQGDNVARIGADRVWGGAIFEAELNGVNMVNTYDMMGREIQMSLYDGDDAYDNCAGCRVWGWNPVQAGDRDGNPGSVTAGWVDGDGFFIRARPNHWHPVALGATYGDPVPSDIIVEQWITAVPDHPFAFKIAYKIIHEGNDYHAPSYLQEFPAVYVNRAFPHFIHYSGNNPWAGEAAVESPLPVLNTARVKRVYTPEKWAAFVDRSGKGMTIYTPGSFPYTVPGFFPGEGIGPDVGTTGYTYSFNPFGLAPGQVIEGDVYLLLGSYREARKTIYELHGKIPIRDISSPVGAVDLGSGSTAGVRQINGWAYDNEAVARVEIRAGDQVLGNATLGQPRADVRKSWPGAPTHTGFTFSVPTTAVPTGATIRARAIDPTGNYSEFVLPN